MPDSLRLPQPTVGGEVDLGDHVPGERSFGDTMAGRCVLTGQGVDACLAELVEGDQPEPHSSRVTSRSLASGSRVGFDKSTKIYTIPR